MHVVASFDPSATSTIPSGSLAGQMGGTFDLKQTGSVKFKVKNDSNISIHCYFPNGSDTVVVAGEEMRFCLDLPTSIVSWIQDTVLNVSGLPLVSKVYVTLYDQTDREQGTYPFHITRLANLGNTVPISTSANVSTLSNEGNAFQLVIDIGPSGHAQLITINNDGSASWSVLQSGVAHQAFKISTSGNPFQAGQANDTVEVVGKLIVDQLLTCISNIVLQNNIPIQWKDSGGTVRSTIDIDNNDAVVVAANSGPGSNHGTIVFNSDTGTSFKILPGTGGVQLGQGTLGFLAGSISRVGGTVSACGSGTVISHGVGTTPSFFAAVPSIAQPGSATLGIGSANSSTFTATIGAGTGIGWFVGTG